MNSRPNILFLFTDQQSATMMSCAGNEWLHTPAMDSLAERGIRFDRAYCTNPVCVPSRFSLLTGRYPSEIDLRSNVSRHIEEVPKAIRETGLGWLMRQAGYDAVYAGKQHLPRMKAEDLGFEVLTRDERDGCAAAIAEYLRSDRDKPFCLVGSFINPHDICFMAIRDNQLMNPDAGEDRAWEWVQRPGGEELRCLDEALKRPEGVSDEEFFEKHCPPLPSNFEPQEDEPDAVAFLLGQRQFRGFARQHYDERRWREHRWAYCRLTEMVDAQIARVLDALREAHLEEDTLVVFSSDHGDNDAAHRMEHKTLLYEEPPRVPFIAAGPGIAGPSVDETHFVSNGLDLLPTFCDYAGAELPDGLLGRSLRGLFDTDAPGNWRDALLVESEVGNAVVTADWKYVKYAGAGEHNEQLYDRRSDPGETRNAAGDPASANELKRLRQLLTGMTG